MQRRTILKTVAGAAVATSGLASVGSAGDPEVKAHRPQQNLRGGLMKQALNNPDEIEIIQEALENKSDIIEELVNRDYLGENSIRPDEVTDTYRLTDDGVYSHTQELVGVRTEDGIVPEVRISRKYDDRVVTMGIRPKTDEQWVIVNGADLDDLQVIDSVTTTDQCDDPCCDSWTCCNTCDCDDDCFCSCDACCADCDYDNCDCTNCVSTI